MKLYANFHNHVIYPWDTVDEKIKKPFEEVTDEIIQEIEKRIDILLEEPTKTSFVSKNKEIRVFNHGIVVGLKVVKEMIK